MISGKHYIMLAEDEENIASTLKQSNYERLCCGAQLPEPTLTSFITENSKLDSPCSTSCSPVLMDWVVQRIQKNKPRCSRHFLTAKGEAADKISGLKIGADDYIVKPFELEEVLLRIQNVLKRNAPKLPPASVLLEAP